MNVAAAYIAAHHERLGLERHGISRRVSCVLLTPRFRLSRHVVFLVLAPGRREPVVVGKLPFLRGDADALAHEARSLRAVAARLSGPDAGTTPAVIAFDAHTPYPLLLETAIAGRPLSPAVVRRERERIVSSVAAWLERLATATATTPCDDAWYERIVDAPLQALARRAEPEVRCMTELTRKRAEVLRASALPLVFEHGDLCHPNLLRQADGRLGVLDWERSDPAGLPGQDLFSFLTYAAGAARGGDVSAAFFGSRAWAWPVAERYAARLGIHAALLCPLLAVSCARAVARGSTAGDRYMRLWSRALNSGRGAR
jgi:aminoglycoside phosphotransferase